MNQIEEIRKICIATSEVLIRNKHRTSSFINFPFGCCRDASILLKIKLRSLGFTDLKFCSRKMDLKFTSHAWLEYDQYIIDITAFQFGSAFPEVIVDNCFFNELYENKIVTMFDVVIAGTDLIGILEDIRILNETSSDLEPFGS